ncbi:MAG TPA: hypothetical protein DDW52_21285, partial [Planctomycetaceae bacterium]|nr:hypothetical protein [Planctomycetaceae bacterium]
FNGTDEFSYRVLDGNGGSDTATVSITVNNVNDAPEIGDFSFSVAENSTDSVGVIGTVVGTDIDTPLANLEYSISGADSAFFEVNVATGEITIDSGVVAGDLNFELKPTYVFDVMVDDGEFTSSGTVTINLTDVAEAGPRITSVRVNSDAWAPLFRDYVDTEFTGAAARGYQIPFGTEQLTTIPWVNVNQILIGFDADVGDSLDINDFDFNASIAGVRADSTTANIPRVLSVDYDSATNIAALTLSQSIDVSMINLKAMAAGIMDSQGNALDGEWTNGVDGFQIPGQSGNGESGGDFEFQINVLPGDAERDGDVDNADVDFASTRSGGLVEFGGTVFVSPNWSEFADVNGSAGSIGSDDISSIRNRIGSRLLP